MARIATNKDNKQNNKLTYLSLFSSAGVGCYAFKKLGFDCVATIELLEKRMAIQRANKKCAHDSGYICADIKQQSTMDKIDEQMKLFGIGDKGKSLDLLVATPPCQGMSVANQKKGDESDRNSLVIESIKLIQRYSPKIFLFENVSAFMKTPCNDIDGQERLIKDAIEINLSGKYLIHSRIVNFKSYGVGQSRTRTLVIGVIKDLVGVSPLMLFPQEQKEVPVRESIGHLRSLKKMGEIDPDDIFHHFRSYAPHMRSWISGLKEGQSAFESNDENKRPHRIIDGKYVPNAKGASDKYKRNHWGKPAACIHTRNDILSSQSTIHPSDDRVFSVRELMLLAGIPDSFKWTDDEHSLLNGLSKSKKAAFLKRHEMTIRHAIGESVPTPVFKAVGENIVWALRGGAHQPNNLLAKTLAEIRGMEMSNGKRSELAAYYTPPGPAFAAVSSLLKIVPKKTSLTILEPSAGRGALLIPLLEALRHHNYKQIDITAIDIDAQALNDLKCLIQKMSLPNHIAITYVCADFLKANVRRHDLTVSNPPFGKSKGTRKNIAAAFLKKIIETSDQSCVVLPKAILSSSDWKESRDALEKTTLTEIIDFGEKAFDGVLIETLAIAFKAVKEPDSKLKVNSYITFDSSLLPQKQLCDPKLPVWLIYRNEEFDAVFKTLKCGVFYSHRDRKLSSKKAAPTPEKSGVRVLRARNIKNNDDLPPSLVPSRG